MALSQVSTLSLLVLNPSTLHCSTAARKISREVFQRLRISKGPIVPATTVMSDHWAVYSKVEDMLEGYQHETVGHNLHFLGRCLHEHHRVSMAEIQGGA